MTMKHLTHYLAVGCLLLLPLATAAQKAESSAYLYGKITTQGGKTYTGLLRWGKEEVFWTDIFNSSKTENPHLDYLTGAQRDDMYGRKHYGRGSWSGAGRNWRWNNRNWSWGGGDNLHRFAIRFGDIKRLTMAWDGRVKLEMKNGLIEHMEDGSNDVEATIHVLDPDIGTIQLNWKELREVEFMPAPKLNEKFGEPIYGLLKTREGDFRGRIQWDEEECLSGDEIDGKFEGGKASIKFGNIRIIEREGNAVRITLKNGHEQTLSGTNDVDDDNRGIVVHDERKGRIKVSFGTFISLTIDDAVGKLPTYDDFANSKTLQGTVKTKEGKTLKGRIVYDLDEQYDSELLDAEQYGIEYQIAFRDIASIMTLSQGAQIKLRNGDSLTLRDGQDVTDSNNGILVFEQSTNPIFVKWEEVDTITFD